MNRSCSLKKFVAGRGALVSALVLTTALAAPLAASSHREAPLTSKKPAIDSTDVYAFVSPGAATTVTLIANWIPFEEPAGGPNFYHFDPLARYLIKVDRDGNGVPDITYEWRFQNAIQNTATFLYNTGRIDSLTDPDYNYRQTYTVASIDGAGVRTVLATGLTMPPDNIGPRSTPNYEALAAAGVYPAGAGRLVFAGQRDDPFYIDLGSIFDLLGLRPFNNAHLIPLAVEPGIDTPGGFNIHTTSIRVPMTELAPACPVPAVATNQNCVIGVWATAELPSRLTRTLAAPFITGSGAFVQVSRLGNPLVNELLVDLARKDAFSASQPTGDGAFLPLILDPELARLIDTLYPAIAVPPPPRNDLVTVFLTGIPNVNRQLVSANSPSEQLRLNMGIAPTAAICAGNRLGFIGGDNAGFPNGRRLEDDATDIALRVVAGGYALAPAGFNVFPNNRLGDGVNVNDRPCLTAFPYQGTPHQGYTHTHHPVGSTTTP
ncbi:MAG TPA: DUF4331 domain-containing protein [Thermoanaerobaculia bacterium]|nr:DUF4331 domain-containing protein [Thermoanaerobaculia bacterium]